MGHTRVSTLEDAVERILGARRQLAAERSLLVGISGIDGSGKGYLTEKIVTQLTELSCRAVAINLDGWLHLPERRFSKDRPAEHFYEQGFRFREMFDQLILPLKERRSLCLEADLADPTGSSEYRKHVYRFDDVDVVILEGAYLFKQTYRGYFDLAIWIDCTFETALERGLQRAQEGLSPEETVAAYETTYFPAQRIHFARDNPRDAADLTIVNDPRLAASLQSS